MKCWLAMVDDCPKYFQSTLMSTEVLGSLGLNVGQSALSDYLGY